ncbi:MAG TPA: FkbM family methyltransferase [Thauera aminoaromatica]|nr:FkbM family methyltransferase [Thauera aminoaromatica]
MCPRVVTDHAGRRSDGAGIGPKNAQLIGGIWLPAAEKHLVDMLVNPECRREVDGRLTYQYRKLERAMQFVPESRRRVAIDIGAHVGLWSMHLARLFGQVQAFEPNLELWDLFGWNLDGCDNVDLHRVALGKSPGTAGLKVYEGHSGHSQISGEGDVRVEPLDSYQLDRVDFIKIDVEGLESLVVNGAMETIQRCQPVMVVEQKGEDARLGFVRDAALGLLQKMGMKPADCIGGDYFMVWE